MKIQTHPRELILASSSPYRKLLLEKLGIPFTTRSPEVDEAMMAGEPAERAAVRLAGEKALAVSASHPSALVIGSDQMAVCEGRIVTKPGSVENAVRQLSELSGNRARFSSGVAAVCGETGFFRDALISTDVHFRPLSAREIERYVAAENPLDCAGGFKSESLGIALFRSIASTDPTALIGLPLITVSNMLRDAGFLVP